MKLQGQLRLPLGCDGSDIHGHSCSMLHIELYQLGHREFLAWELDKSLPDGLIDPTELLMNALQVQYASSHSRVDTQHSNDATDGAIDGNSWT